MKTVIALQPEARQIGYAVFEGKDLIDWGTKSIGSVPVAKRVYTVALPFVRSLIERHQPDLIVLSQPTDNPTTVRTRFLRAVRYESCRQPQKLCFFSRRAIHKAFQPFLQSKRVNKSLIMQLLARWFPELRRSLPRPRRLWESQDYWVSMFDAIALGITHLSRNE